MKNRRAPVFLIIFLFSLACCLALFTCQSVPRSAPVAPAYAGSLPACPGTLAGGAVPDHEVHEYLGFSLCYRESYEEAEWVCYTLTPAHLVKNAERADDFREDPAITSGSASPDDYRRSGYDRGHLAPSRDMSWSTKANSESFLMSNMTPQVPAFNRGIWRSLEQVVRSWAEGAESVRVVTGPVLSQSAQDFPHIGQNEVAVPAEFYKALLLTAPDGERQCAAFVIPNERCEEDILHYAVTVDEAEELTGLDFFSDLPDEEELPLESAIGSLFLSAPVSARR